MSTFSSEGFDLDAVVSQDDGGDVVYEIGGGATVSREPEDSSEPLQGLEEENPLNPMATAEEWKRQGNEQFQHGHYLEAYDLYTEAIGSCPGDLKGDEILKQRDEFNEAERAKAFSRQRLADEERREKAKKNEDTESKSTTSTTDKKPEPPAEFKLPSQDYGDKLAIYYCNRAAALMHMERYDDAIRDCDVSVLLNPKYTKAFVRRSAAFEKSERTDEALNDAKKALELEPSNATIRKTVARLQKIEDARLEKLKEETLGKLKDLGNSILGNFGLSLDNFKAVQDPKTGSYNISFNQNGQKP